MKKKEKKNEECPFCHSHNIEKFDEYVQAKCKLDIPKPIVIIELDKKTYWLAGFDAAGEIWEIKYEEKERINDYDPLHEKLWDMYRNKKRQN